MASIDTLAPDMLERLINETDTIYSLPLIYERLTEVINHPRSSIADITRIISEDPGLTARLLKLANSPMFGFFSKIDTIDKAATVIGTQQLQALALAVSVMEVFTGIPEELVNMKSFWQHSIACGIIARTLAIYHREINAERVFAAGILHDVGRLVMFITIPDIVKEMIAESRNDEALLFRTEENRFGFTHATVGGGLLANWKIPESITEPVSCHHSPVAAKKFNLETSFIHMADIICKALGIGCTGEPFVPPLEPSTWERMDIPAGSLVEIMRQAEPQLEETLAILGESVL
jgi:HD-like signal output (HDOD) protein